MGAKTDISYSVLCARIVGCGNYVRFDRGVVYGTFHTNASNGRNAQGVVYAWYGMLVPSVANAPSVAVWTV